MAKDPAFLFYTGDFSTGTQFFTDAQVGIYLRLLMAQHQHGHLSEQQVLHISKSYDNEVMKKFVKDSDGNYYNERLENEIIRRKEYSISRSNNRKKPNGKGKGTKKHMKNISGTYVNHMETENETKDINTNELKDDFDLLLVDWFQYKKDKRQSYKSDKSKLACKNKLINLSNNNTKLAAQIIEQSMANNWDGLFALKTAQVVKTQQQPQTTAPQLPFIKPKSN